jgi:hypothetical protein
MVHRTLALSCKAPAPNSLIAVPCRLQRLVRPHPPHPHGLRFAVHPFCRADCRANVNRRPFFSRQECSRRLPLAREWTSAHRAGGPLFSRRSFIIDGERGRDFVGEAPGRANTESMLLPRVGRTPGISCKAPISPGLVSFIPLFDAVVAHAYVPLGRVRAAAHDTTPAPRFLELTSPTQAARAWRGAARATSPA